MDRWWWNGNCIGNNKIKCKIAAYLPFVGYQLNWNKVYIRIQVRILIPNAEIRANLNLAQNTGY